MLVVYQFPYCKLYHKLCDNSIECEDRIDTPCKYQIRAEEEIKHDK